jgi:four helix bundle protein
LYIQKFTDLEVWKESHKLTLLVYNFTKNFPKDETFGLTSQIRRAVVSIESNIAEGFSRYHFKDRLNFYYQSRGSASEVQTQLIIAKDLEYITQIEFLEAFNLSQKVLIILSGLIRSTEALSKNKKIT